MARPAEQRFGRYGYYQGDAPSSPQSHDDWVKYSDYSCIYEGKGVSAPEVENAQMIPKAEVIDGKDDSDDVDQKSRSDKDLSLCSFGKIALEAKSNNTTVSRV